MPDCPTQAAPGLDDERGRSRRDMNHDPMLGLRGQRDVQDGSEDDRRWGSAIPSDLKSG
jgi:hypothetical protein